MILSVYEIKKVIKEKFKIYRLFRGICISVMSFIRLYFHLSYVVYKFIFLFKKKYSLGVYSKKTLKQFCIEQSIFVDIKDSSKEREVFIPKYWNNNDCEKKLKLDFPQIYTTLLFDVEIIGGNSFILKDGLALYDMFCLEEKRFDLRFGSIISQNTNKIIIKQPDTIECIKKGISLIGFASWNYYHFTIELLSKLKYLDLNYPEYPIIIDEAVSKTPQLIDLLNAVNIMNRNLIVLKTNIKYRVKELVYISDITTLPINVKGRNVLLDRDCLVSPEAIIYVKDKVYKKYKINNSNLDGVKVFISRKSKYLQRLENEREIEDVFVNNGFIVVYPEELSFEDQVQLFSKANCIAGVSGAALTNIIYCMPNTLLISIIPKEYNFNLYSTIANALNIRCLFLDAKILKKGKKISGDTYFLNKSCLSSFFMCI